MNPSWCLLNPDAKVVHLTRCHSNHCPVLLEAQPRVGVGRMKLFRFQSCWLSDPTFPRVVSQAWQHPTLLEAFKVFTKDALKWNQQQFGNIFQRKKSIMARINGIQWVNSIRPSTFLLNLDREWAAKGARGSVESRGGIMGP